MIDLQKTKDKTIVSKCFEKQTIALVQTKKNLPLIGFNEVSSSQISSTKLISAMTWLKSFALFFYIFFVLHERIDCWINHCQVMIGCHFDQRRRASKDFLLWFYVNQTQPLNKLWVGGCAGILYVFYFVNINTFFVLLKI